jgi:hypothetical protein
MVTKRNSRKSRTIGPAVLGKPNGVIQPRVQAVGPERFGIVAVDCAKARSKWMLCDFYGNVLIPPLLFCLLSESGTRCRVPWLSRQTPYQRRVRRVSFSPVCGLRFVQRGCSKWAIAKPCSERDSGLCSSTVYPSSGTQRRGRHK